MLQLEHEKQTFSLLPYLSNVMSQKLITTSAVKKQDTLVTLGP